MEQLFFRVGIDGELYYVADSSRCLFTRISPGDKIYTSHPYDKDECYQFAELLQSRGFEVTPAQNRENRQWSIYIKGIPNKGEN